MITGRIPWHAYLTKSKMLDVTYQVLHIKEKHVLLGPSVIGDFLLYPPLCNNTLFINYLCFEVCKLRNQSVGSERQGMSM
jgi:hypothetical protein